MSRQIRCTAAAVGLLVCGTPAGALRAQATDRAAVVARADSIVRNAVTPLAPGYSVAVVRGRDTVLWKGYGSANLELSVPASVNTVYRIGSITKQFTAAAVLQLVEQSKLHLDDPVARHLPNAPAHWQPVRVRHLLNHTSGIPSFTELGGRMRTAYLTGLSGDSMVGLVRGDSLMFAPGTGFFYNNTAYYLLGRIIERVSGKSYATYVTEHLTKPLGLSRTTYCSNRLILEGRASGYEPQDGALVNSRALDMDVPFSAGALCSTVGDLTTWTRALASGRVVRPDSYQQMTSPAALPSVYPMTWGYGVHVDTAGTHCVLGHSGGIYGFTGQLSHYPEDSLIVVVLANSSAHRPAASRRTSRGRCSGYHACPSPHVRFLPPWRSAHRWSGGTCWPRWMARGRRSQSSSRKGSWPSAFPDRLPSSSSARVSTSSRSSGTPTRASGSSGAARRSPV
jgi:CubicO group peptidase (beta-lactamase class C family)